MKFLENVTEGIHILLDAEISLRVNAIIWVWSSIYMTESAAAAAKSLQSCPTLCDPIDGSPPGSPVPGILQATTLEWVAISFSNAWKWKVNVKSLSRAQLLATPWTAAYQAPPSMGFSRQEYWSGLPLPSLMTESSPGLITGVSCNEPGLPCLYCTIYFLKNWWLLFDFWLII